MKLTHILKKECILAPLQADDKSEVIQQLVHVLAERGYCTDEQKLLSAVNERETIRSTGIGKGLAVPHGKSDSCDRLVMALGKLDSPVDFESKDGEPTKIVALLASPPNETGPHIQALARISRLMLMDEFRDALTRATSPDEIYSIIASSEV